MILCSSWTYSLGQQQEVSADKTIPAEPLSVVPAPTNSVTPDASKTSPVNPGSPVNPDQGLSGTSQEIKNPDGSVVHITHFRGQLPSNGAFGANPFGKLLSFDVMISSLKSV